MSNSDSQVILPRKADAGSGKIRAISADNTLFTDSARLTGYITHFKLKKDNSFALSEDIATVQTHLATLLKTEPMATSSTYVMNSDAWHLAEAILGYRRLQEYNGLYTAYLLGQLSEDEFQEESEEFIQPPSNMTKQELAEKISCLIKYTDDNYLPSDMADIFQCSEEQVAEAIAILKNSPPEKNILQVSL